MVNSRNANCFTGKQGYKSLEKIAEQVSQELTNKQKIDEETPKKIKSKEIMLVARVQSEKCFLSKKLKIKLQNL